MCQQQRYENRSQTDNWNALKATNFQDYTWLHQNVFKSNTGKALG